MQKNQKKYDGICSDCIHWQSTAQSMPVGIEKYDQSIGECRRHIPMFMQGCGRVFPVTGFHDWCSEGVQKEKEKTAPWWHFWKWGKK